MVGTFFSEVPGDRNPFSASMAAARSFNSDNSFSSPAKPTTTTAPFAPFGEDAPTEEAVAIPPSG